MTYPDTVGNEKLPLLYRRRRSPSSMRDAPLSHAYAKLNLFGVTAAVFLLSAVKRALPRRSAVPLVLASAPVMSAMSNRSAMGEPGLPGGGEPGRACS